MNKNPIIITGIHRSGTTLLSKIFEKNKVFFGTKKDLNNEALFFQNLNKWLLSCYGISWENPKYIDFELNKNRFDMILFKLQKILNSRLNFRYLGLKSLVLEKKLLEIDFDWGWKDPRNIFSLPFWLKLFPESKVLILIRHPFDVVNSLITRNKYLLEKDIKLKDKLSNYMLIPFLNVRNYSNLSSDISDFDIGMRLYDCYYNQLVLMTEKYNSNIKIIKYEDLVLKKEDVVLNLFEFCNISLNNETKTFIETIRTDRLYNFKLNKNNIYKKYSEKIKKYEYSIEDK